MDIKIQELLAYTEWERDNWRSWFLERGKAPLEVTTYGERHKDIADLIQHIFAVELRYVQRLKGQPLTPYSQIPKASAEELFDFGSDSRVAFRELVNGTRDWNRIFEFNILDFSFKATVRKYMTHILMHEIRHWAQIALLLRLAGYQELGSHDLLDSDSIR
jgi:uncharacterized damage-inducible protein DinB